MIEDADKDKTAGRGGGNERFRRLFRIDRRLSEHHEPLSASELCRHINAAGDCDVTLRTIRNDLDFLLSLSGHGSFKLVVDRSRQPWLYSIPPGGSLFRRNFTRREAHLLRELLEVIGSFDGIQHGGALDELFRTVEIGNNTRRIVNLGISPYHDRKLFSRIYNAIAEREVMSLKYLPVAEFGKPESAPRTIIFHPLQIRHDNGRWALMGTDEKDNYLCRFYLDQIVGFDTLERKYPYEEYRRLAGLYDYVAGGVLPRQLCEADGNDHNPDTIIVAAHADSGNDVDLFPVHPDQDELPEDSVSSIEWREKFPGLEAGARIFVFESYITGELVRTLAARAAELTVLSPRSLREAVRNRLLRGLEAY